jgi:hypothetical protein
VRHRFTKGSLVTEHRLTATATASPSKSAIKMPLKFVAIVAIACAAVTACGSHPPSQPGTSVTSSTTAPTSSSASVSRSTSSSAGTPSSTPACVGLSICPPPSPDAEGNPGCYYSDGWQGNSAGAGIEIWYFHEPQNLSKPDKVTAIVRKKDGTTESQDANIDAGQQTHRFEFPAIDKSAVQEVLLSTSSGRCFVIGPGG